MPEKKLHMTLVGPAATGKSLYLKRVMRASLGHTYEPTIGARVEIGSPTINDEPWNLYLWEMGGAQPRDPASRRAIMAAHLQRTDMVVVFVDLNDPEGLNKIADNFTPAQLKDMCRNPHAQFMLIGTLTKLEATRVISDMDIINFTVDHKFKGSATITRLPGIETTIAFKRCVTACIAAKRDIALAEIDAYSNRRRTEGFKSLIAYVAWCLGLSYFFGHYKEDEKLQAAAALRAALMGIYHHLERLSAREKGALQEGNLGRIFAQLPNHEILRAKLSTARTSTARLGSH